MASVGAVLSAVSPFRYSGIPAELQISPNNKRTSLRDLFGLESPRVAVDSEA